jgi:leucine-rich repeat protein SHOC2
VALVLLRLENNLLTSLPSAIEKLSELRGLYLSANELSELFPQIGALSSLEALEVKDNRLKQLPG